MRTLIKILFHVSTAILLITPTLGYAAFTQTLNMVPPASNDIQQGFIRLQNNNDDAVTVTITGIDDEGSFGDSNLIVTIPAHASQQLNSNDIEFGNPNKNMEGALGDGSGNWRLLVQSSTRIKVSAYIRTPNGFLTQMDATTDELYGQIHSVPMFNPASNANQVSRVRLINTSTVSNNFLITGTDDSGKTGLEALSITLGPLQSIELTAQELENGSVQKGLNGRLGDGEGKWSLDIFSGQTALVMNLLEAPGGYLSNLSTIANKEPSYETATCSDFDGAKVYSSQEPPVYLGFLGGSFASDSIYNSVGQYGSSVSSNSVRNQFGTYGSSTSILSHNNPNATNPPIIVKQGNTLALLTVNSLLQGRISLATLDSNCVFSSASASDTFAMPR